MNCVAKLEGHRGIVWNISWHPTEMLLATCGQDKTIRIWQAINEGDWICTETLDGSHTKSVRRVCWSASGALLGSASFDGTVIIWKKLQQGFEAALTLEGHESEVKGLGWNRDDRLLATCGRDKSVWVWETDIDFEYETAAVLSRHTQDVKTVAFATTSDLLASGSYDNTICIWKEDVGEWVCIDVLTGHEGTVWSLVWIDQCLVSSSDDSTIRMWNLGQDNKFHLTCTLSGNHSGKIFSIDSVPTLPFLVSGGSDDVICVFQKEDRMLLCKEESAQDMDINCVSLCPTSPLLGSCSDDETVKIWRINL